MFNCGKCNKAVGPCESPVMQPVGYKRDENGRVTGDRLGEAMLCKNCALAFKGSEDRTIEVLGGFRYEFFRL